MNFMQHDEQQDKSLLERGDPFDPCRWTGGDQANNALDKAGKGAPEGPQSDRPAQKQEKGLLDTLREQGQQALGNLGGIGDMIGSQPAGTSYEPQDVCDDVGSVQGQQTNARKSSSSSDNDISKPTADRGQQERASRNARPARPGNNPRSSYNERGDGMGREKEWRQADPIDY